MLLFYFLKKDKDFNLEDFNKDLANALESSSNEKKIEETIKKLELKEVDKLTEEYKKFISKLRNIYTEVELINYIKVYLNERITCKTVQTVDEILEYPRIFYVLRGHYLEYALYKINFKDEQNLTFDRFKDFKGIILKDMLTNAEKIVFIIPNELKYIFN